MWREKVLTLHAYLSEHKYKFTFEALFENVEGSKFSETQGWQEITLRGHGVWAFIPVRRPVIGLKTNKKIRKSPWKVCEDLCWKTRVKKKKRSFREIPSVPHLTGSSSVCVRDAGGGPSTTSSLMWGNKPVLYKPNQSLGRFGTVLIEIRI